MFSAVNVEAFGALLSFFAHHAVNRGRSCFEAFELDLFFAFDAGAKSSVLDPFEGLRNFFKIEGFSVSKSHSHGLFDLRCGEIYIVQPVVSLDVKVFVDEGFAVDQVVEFSFK